MAGALALITVAFTSNQPVVMNLSHCGPSGQCYTWVDTGTVPSILGQLLVGGALPVALGSIVDGRFGWRSRVAPLVMVVAGAIVCALATLLAGGRWLDVAFAPSISRVDLDTLYLPTAVVSGVCALIALLPRQLFGAQSAPPKPPHDA
jgi:hypothetical protein